MQEKKRGDIVLASGWGRKGKNCNSHTSKNQNQASCKFINSDK